MAETEPIRGCHVPLPWHRMEKIDRWEHSAVAAWNDKKTARIVIAGVHPSGQGEIVDDANTDLIVRAVNNHARLLAACKLAKDALAAHVAYDDTSSAECDAFHEVRAAILAAEEPTPFDK